MKTTADLHSSHLAVESHGPGGVGGDFAGILLPALTATICEANTPGQVMRGEKRGGTSSGSVATSDHRDGGLCTALENRAGGGRALERKRGGGEKHAEAEKRGP